MYQSNSGENNYSQDESKLCFTPETQKTLCHADVFMTKQENIQKYEPLSPMN